MEKLLVKKLKKFYDIGKSLPEKFYLNYGEKRYEISSENYLWLYFQSFEHIAQEKLLYSVFKTAFPDEKEEIDNCLGFMLFRHQNTFDSLRILTRDRKYYMKKEDDFTAFLENFRERIKKCRFTSLIINDNDHRVIIFIYNEDNHSHIYIYDPIEISEAIWKFFKYVEEKWNSSFVETLSIDKKEGTFCPIQPYTGEMKFCIMWTNLWIYCLYSCIPELENAEQISEFINSLGDLLLSIDKKDLRKILLGFTISIINKFQEMYSKPKFGKEFFFSECEERLKGFFERYPEWFTEINTDKRKERIRLKEGGERIKKDGDPCETSKECLSDYCRRCGKNKCCKPYPYNKPY